MVGSLSQAGPQAGLKMGHLADTPMFYCNTCGGSTKYHISPGIGHVISPELLAVLVVTLWHLGFRPFVSFALKQKHHVARLL